MKRKLPKLKDNERKALLELKERLKDKFGDKLKKIILYGSKARGDSDSESDIDVLLELSDRTKKGKPVILSSRDGSKIELPQVSSKVKSAISHIASEIGLKYDLLLMCAVYTTKRLKLRKKIWMPFIENVMKEGILV